MSETFFERISQPCPHPPGTRIELSAPMPNDPWPVPVGTRGTVTGGSGAQLWVRWDNGSRLALLIGEDSYTVIEAVR